MHPTGQIFKQSKFPDPLSFVIISRMFWRNLTKIGQIKGCVPLGESGSGFLVCGVPFEQIHFQISDLSNPLWTRIHRITDQTMELKQKY